MLQRVLKRKEWLLPGLLFLAAAAAGVAIWGCGTKDYGDPSSEYYQNDGAANTLVEPARVKAWVDNGCVTEKGERVVIIDCFPFPTDKEGWFAGNVTKIKADMASQYGGASSPQYKMIDGLENKHLLGHIPGAIANASHEGYEVTVRNDGPIEAEHEVGTGSLIDQLLGNHGITKNDILVLTTSRYDYPGFCATRLWWTLYYWGFAKDRIFVLNGGNKAYAMAGGTLVKGVTVPVITPSGFSVTELPRKRFEARMSLGELISLVDSGRTALADNNAGKVVVVDTRQPPAAYYFLDNNADGTPDIFQLAGYTYSASTKLFTRNADNVTLTLSEILFKETTPPRVGFSATTNPPIPLPNPFVGIHIPTGAALSGGPPLAFPLGAKGAAFEGIVKGAKVTKTSAYNITVPALSRADGGYKTKAELLPIFAAAGIDGTKPIVVYCNSGALAAIYYYAFQEICGFKDVRMYDGSWQEWALLAAYEPADTTYVISDDFGSYPSYPAGSPSVVFFAGPNRYMEWNGAGFVDSYTGAPVPLTQVKAGGTLAGNPKWDTVHRSEHVIFRPTSIFNDPAHNKTYNSAVDWPTVTTHPSYNGSGSEILLEDRAYKGASGGSSGGGPSPYVSPGGGC